MIILIFLSSIFLIFPALASEKIIIQYHIRPPFFIEDPKTGLVNSGVIYKLVTNIMNDTKIPFEFEKMSFARTMLEIKQNSRRICYPAANYNSERKKYANFSVPFFKDKNFVIIARKDDKRIPSNANTEELLNNNDLKLLLKIGYSYGDEIDKKLLNYKNYSPSMGAQKESKSLLISSMNNLQMIETISNKEADYFFMGGNEAEFILTYFEKNAKNLRIVPLANAISGSVRHFMCTLRVEKEEIDKINNSIKKIMRTGN
ncbi:substrate-binding periplasmic protein [Fluviispira vulneris]|uniref:substrate-binding periplasmic protein n=1 Tax=Fluviispira vulneris TaxID=2763012 RepID=UPI001648B6C8|nr:transporter substrate-binding domain-containing protein [Fluviispira vulneris]